MIYVASFITDFAYFVVLVGNMKQITVTYLKTIVFNFKHDENGRNIDNEFILQVEISHRRISLLRNKINKYIHGRTA